MKLLKDITVHSSSDLDGEIEARTIELSWHGGERLHLRIPMGIPPEVTALYLKRAVCAIQDYAWPGQDYAWPGGATYGLTIVESTPPGRWVVRTADPERCYFRPVAEYFNKASALLYAHSLGHPVLEGSPNDPRVIQFYRMLF